MKNSIYPLTIISDRYTGTYSGAVYTAWNLEAQDIPMEVSGGDPSCMNFWYNFKGVVGLGNTPNEAKKDLEKQILNQNK